MTVVVTDQPLAPSLALTSGFSLEAGADADFSWTPDIAPIGPVSILVSGAEQRAVVLRNGRLTGWPGCAFKANLERPQLFAVTDLSPQGPIWTSLALPGQQAPAPLAARIEGPAAFPTLVEPLLTPGATVIVTPDPLRLDQPGTGILEGSPRPAGKQPQGASDQKRMPRPTPATIGSMLTLTRLIATPVRSRAVVSMSTYLTSRFRKTRSVRSMSTPAWSA